MFELVGGLCVNQKKQESEILHCVQNDNQGHQNDNKDAFRV